MLRKTRLKAYVVVFSAVDWSGLNGLPRMAIQGYLRVWVRHWKRADQAALLLLHRRGLAVRKIRRMQP